ncbi:hypothetical protein AB0A74_31415 [Saccharothrix sp. NPDC042600]|uniref:hypothetical protein n=1 Tax=Saccharothrix sp. NPDC042600 TaxID=3154492 RepID=UPI0033DAC369|nr:hypothetical protein GCM10017745_57910 [Saccharothrix mutabilis subsp. capreolus]
MSVAELVDAVDRAIRTALSETCPPHDPATCARAAHLRLVEALESTHRGDEGLPGAAQACVDAACEHLRYGELLEARILLTAALGQLAPARTPADGAAASTRRRRGNRPA